MWAKFKQAWNQFEVPFWFFMFMLLRIWIVAMSFVIPSIWAWKHI